MTIEVKLPTIFLPSRCWAPSHGTSLCKFSGCRQPPMEKNKSWSRLLLPEAMPETCWHILQFWCGSYQTLDKLCHLMLQSSDLNKDWFFLQSEIDFMMPNPGVAIFPFRTLCKSLLILLTNWWYVLSHLRETWLERGAEWIHSYQILSKLEKVYIFKCHFNN